MIRNQFNLLALYAFRYALGRRTYAVQDMGELLIKNIDQLDDLNKTLIRREIIDAIKRRDAGADCDVISWNQLLEALDG